MSHVRTSKIGGLDCPECMCFVNILGRGAASTCGTDKSPASAMCFVRGEGLTRIALRKYTSFGVHLAVKHFEAWPSIHPNINRFSVTLRLSKLSVYMRALKTP